MTLMLGPKDLLIFTLLKQLALVNFPFDFGLMYFVSTYLGSIFLKTKTKAMLILPQDRQINCFFTNLATSVLSYS